MKRMATVLLVVSLGLPAVCAAQDLYQSTRTLEQQRALSHIAQAEYYLRMALRSLTASETIGTAPYFDYQSARNDMEQMLAEFNRYLRGDAAIIYPAALPVVIDGRYFSESMTKSIAELKTKEEDATNHRSATQLVPLKVTPKPLQPRDKSPAKNSEEKRARLSQGSSTTVKPPAVRDRLNGASKRRKIEDILKNGL